MILTDPELQQIRHKIEAQAGLNEELWRRCGDLVHMGNFDEAVRSAFVLLEERLREAAHKDGLTGAQLANYALNAKNGPLAKHLARTDSEREGGYVKSSQVPSSCFAILLLTASLGIAPPKAKPLSV